MGNLENFLEENRLSRPVKISKGWSAEIFLVRGSRGKRSVLKVLREKSNRRKMAQRESENLLLANSAGVGPKFVKADLEKNIVMMEFVEGVPFGEWIFSGVSKKELQRFVGELCSQAKKLDGLGLDHGQLAGRGKNILVRKGLPVIIDFEKASRLRKVHNAAVLDSFLFRSKGSAVVKKISGILGADFA